MPKQNKIRLRLSKNPQTREYLVLVEIYRGGAYRRYEPATYFTDDKEDAIGTRNLMQQEYVQKGYDVTLS